MTDQDLERVLRTTMTDRAGTVTTGPAWGGPDQLRDRSRTGRRRTRWLAPLAAAVVVAAVAGGVIAYRGTATHPAAIKQPPPSGNQLPIPRGMKAVDALGVEIFVPNDFAVDDFCAAHGVIRPVVFARVPSCPARLNRTVVGISRSTGRSAGACAGHLALDGEMGCLTKTGSGSLLSPYSFSAVWPKHGASLTVGGREEALGLQIIRSAHAVPIDRNGCAARRDRMLPDARTDLVARPVLSTGARTVSVCWYLNNRLGASALLSGSAVRQVISAVNSAPPKWPPPIGRPALPSCETVSRSDGVLLAAHTAGQPDVDAVGNFAACNGQQTVYNGSSAVLATSDLATAIAGASGIPITLDYKPLRH